MNKSSPEANTKNIRNRMILSPVFILQRPLEILHPLAEMAFVDTPLATDLESGQFVLLDHPPHRPAGQLQQLSGFLKRQQAYRLVMVFHRCFHTTQLSNADAMTLLSIAARLWKSSSAVDDMKGH
jgi:hypothetical protein